MGRRTGRQGFASMDADKQRAIASKGGKAAHAKGTAHRWTHEEAVAAGRKGGQAKQASAAPNTASTAAPNTVAPTTENSAIIEDDDDNTSW